MKKIFSIAAIALMVNVFGQEAGKAGELLKNEAPTTEMQTQRREYSTPRNENNSGFRKSNTVRNNKRDYNRPGSYQWNYNYGYSEVFLRIPERGDFTVEIGEQMMSNSSGKFRFFDLNAGNNIISIYQNNYLVYRTRLNIRNNSRLVLDFFTNYGLYLLDTYPVRNQDYGFNDWNDVWNNPYGNGNGSWGSGGNGYYGGGNLMDNSTFDQYMNAFKKNSFDDSKIDFLRQQRNTAFTTPQIVDMLRAFSFEDNKLEAAKLLYNVCADKQNFFRVYDVFSFNSSKKELMEYISSR